jgi:hypothetical protein
MPGGSAVERSAATSCNTSSRGASTCPSRSRRSRAGGGRRRRRRDERPTAPPRLIAVAEDLPDGGDEARRRNRPRPRPARAPGSCRRLAAGDLRELWHQQEVRPPIPTPRTVRMPRGTRRLPNRCSPRTPRSICRPDLHAVEVLAGRSRPVRSRCLARPRCSPTSPGRLRDECGTKLPAPEGGHRLDARNLDRETPGNALICGRPTAAPSAIQRSAGAGVKDVPELRQP